MGLVFYSDESRVDEGVRDASSPEDGPPGASGLGDEPIKGP
jgi:hypothetical protein